jgi:hypothetical protein
MNAQAFDVLLERRIELTRAVLAAKAAEYATGVDKLHNFKRSAELANEVQSLPDHREWFSGINVSAAQEAAAFMRKYLVSVFDLINRHSSGVKIDRSTIDEKIGDAINYLILIEALLNEKKSGV